MSNQMAATKALIFEASIERKFLGGQEDVTFEEFYTRVVQDYEAGMNVVQLMLAGEDPFPWNEDEPEFYEEFRIINRNALEAQTIPTIVTPELEQLASSQEADDLLDIVVELEQDPAAAQSVEQMQESFGRTISELGGTVMDEAWINHTLRARIPARGLPDLAQLATVRTLDLPHKLKADTSQTISQVDLARRHAAVYDALASEYDTRAPSLVDVTQESLEQLFAVAGSRRGRALDVGCGAGVVSRGLLDAGFGTTAIDVSTGMVEACRARAPEAEVLQADYLDHQFDQPFDVIVAFAFIHLFPTALALECLAKMREDLAAQGLLLIGTTAEASSREGLEGKVDYPGAPRRYRRRWTEEGFLIALQQAGFDVLDVARHVDPFGKRWTDAVARPRVPDDGASAAPGEAAALA